MTNIDSSFLLNVIKATTRRTTGHPLTSKKLVMKVGQRHGRRAGEPNSDPIPEATQHYGCLEGQVFLDNTGTER